MKKIYCILITGLLAFAQKRLDNNTPQNLPFTQDWTNTGQITTDDNWTGVQGVEGYLGQDITTGIGIDPQTLLGVSATANDLDVIANQSNPSISNGGVAEFDGIANPTIALQGSATADAPYIIFYLNTTSLQNITVAYNLRDIDGSADDAVQPVAMQYRVGNTGDFTNVPSGFVADATEGPGLATKVTPVSAVLPAACNNQSQIQVRVITSNASGNDEWVGIDDISITGTPLVPTVYTWVGGNSTWTAAANWSPVRTTPAASDILQFNDGTTVVVTAVPTETIGRLLLSNNTNVTLQSAAANTLTIAGDTGADLDVPAGTTLNTDGINALVISLSTGATGSVGGSLTFSAGAHRLLGADPSSITFLNGSSFTSGTGFSGNAFGTTNLNSVVFANGSVYNYIAGGSPFGAVQPSSVVVFQTGSLFKHLSASAPEFSGRTYANFEYDFAGSVSTAGVSAVSIDNLTITQGSFNINMTGTPGHSIKGNITVATGATLTFSPGSTGTINLNGTANQVISNSGTFTCNGNSTIVIIKSSGNVILNNNIQLNHLTILTSNALDLNGTTLSITGDMTNSGTLFTNLGTVNFSGTSGTQVLTTYGTGTGKALYNLSHSGAGTLQLMSFDLRVTNNFTNNAGPFDRNGQNVTVGGDFVVNGIYTPGTGTLTFNGSSNQNWSGTGSNNYGNVVVNKSAGNMVLASNVQVNDLVLTSGKVVLGTNNLVVGGVVTGGSTVNYVQTNSTGTITVNNIGVSGVSLPIGNSKYNPLVIANGSGHNWTARVEDAVNNVIAPFNTDKAVLRTWTITPSVNPPSAGADITFQYDDSDPSQLGPSFNTSENVQVWHYDFAWIAASAPLSPTGSAGSIRTVTRTGWSKFSSFAIANSSGPLPVTFYSFSGFKDGTRNQLRWTTATEIHNRGFEVLRSTDGVSYLPIGFVNSQAQGGNSSTPTSYAFTDNVPAGIRQYYRLRQEDLAGQSTLSSIVLIQGNQPTLVAFDAVFPNPADNAVNLLIAAPARGKITVLVTDMAGQTLLKQIAIVETGSNTIRMDLQSLRGGIYLVRIINSEGKEGGTIKFVKQ